MYVNGSSFRALERVKGVYSTTVITWVEQVGSLLPDAYNLETVPQVGELDELETFVGEKKQGLALDSGESFSPSHSGLGYGDRSAKTYESVWLVVQNWQCFFYVTDGYPVYPKFIPDGDQIVSKTYMTRVEGENTRLRHYLACLHRKILCYSKSIEMLKHSIRLPLHYLTLLGCSCSSLESYP
ncbi:MAG TPA: IS1 family transposase [Elainellaceae cyanobacterium]